MNMHHCPALTAVVAQQRHQALQHEAERWQAADMAAAATTTSRGGPWPQLKRAAASVPAAWAAWRSGAARLWASAS
jgi:hypothetical protein